MNTASLDSLISKKSQINRLIHLLLHQNNLPLFYKSLSYLTQSATAVGKLEK